MMPTITPSIEIGESTGTWAGNEARVMQARGIAIAIETIRKPENGNVLGVMCHRECQDVFIFIKNAQQQCLYKYYVCDRSEPYTRILVQEIRYFVLTTKRSYQTPLYVK